MTSAQRERYIAACGRHMVACYKAGDRETARNWLAAQKAAIAERTKEQRDRMALAAGLPLEDGCWFMLDAARERAAAQGRAQA